MLSEIVFENKRTRVLEIFLMRLILVLKKLDLIIQQIFTVFQKVQKLVGKLDG